jgi:arylsulfatase A-like enzyme
VGKWHLGAHPSLHPNQRGFKEFFGFLGGGHTYLPGEKGGVEYLRPLQFNGEERPHEGYLTDILGQQAAEFIKRHSGASASWFLYLAFNAPHTPLSAPEDQVAKFSHITDKNRRTYAAMVHGMDAAVGTAMKALQESGRLDNTLVFFVSDNGGPDLRGRKLGKFTDNSPLRGAKGALTEGGIRVPFLVSWPAKVKPGTYDQPVIALDAFATAASAAGAQLPMDRVMDSVDLVPFLTGESALAPHENLFWRTHGPGGNYAMRTGEWKLLRDAKAESKLFNLAADPGEAKNLASNEPERVKVMLEQLQKWEEGTVPPVFENPKAGGPAKKKKKA